LAGLERQSGLGAIQRLDLEIRERPGPRRRRKRRGPARTTARSHHPRSFSPALSSIRIRIETARWHRRSKEIVDAQVIDAAEALPRPPVVHPKRGLVGFWIADCLPCKADMALPPRHAAPLPCPDKGPLELFVFRIPGNAHGRTHGAAGAIPNQSVPPSVLHKQSLGRLLNLLSRQARQPPEINLSRNLGTGAREYLPKMEL
jgi:hypothetical protein